MNREGIRATVLGCLKSVAPEADLASLGGAADLRDALDIDSMDFLRFVVKVHEALHVAGLGEHPHHPGAPTPVEIDRMVKQRCGL